MWWDLPLQAAYFFYFSVKSLPLSQKKLNFYIAILHRSKTGKNDKCAQLEKSNSASPVFAVIPGYQSWLLKVLGGLWIIRCIRYGFIIHTNYDVVSFLQLFLHMTFCVCNLWHRIPWLRSLRHSASISCPFSSYYSSSTPPPPPSTSALSVTVPFPPGLSHCEKNSYSVMIALSISSP